MDGLRGVKQEERLVGRFLLVVLQKLEALLQEDHVHLLEVEAGRDHAGPVVA